MRARSLVNGLVYPVPHRRVTVLACISRRRRGARCCSGRQSAIRSGKDDYEENRLPLDAFLEETRALLPEITLADLQPGSSGIRAKLCPPDQPFADFLIAATR